MSRAHVDLRSDTLTRPSPRMREAMAAAEVGDDVFGEDPTVNRLQDRAAALLGREAGLFVPSGSMGNLVCLLAQTEPGTEVICDDQSHIYNYEMASMAAVAGVLPRVVPSDDGILRWEQIEAAIRPKIYYRAQTAIVALENTHNMAGGRVYPSGGMAEIVGHAHAAGLKVHLDGARIFNAAAFLGQDVASLTEGVDSVQFCLSKGLGAPVGSLVVGSRAFVERCRRYRKMLGGGMRQAGILAAAGLVALETGPARLHDDHAHARRLARGLETIPGVEVAPVETNIVIFSVGRPWSGAEEFASALADRGVLAVAIDRRRVRMVTHLDVSSADIEEALGALASMERVG